MNTTSNLWKFSRAVFPILGIYRACFAGDELPVAQRIESRTFPSVFMAWSPAEHVSNEDKITTLARHDLIFNGPWFFKLRWTGATHEGLCESFTTQSVAAARAFRAELLKRNPNLILLAEIRHHDAQRDFLPEDSPWWQRDGGGRKKQGWDEGGYLMLNFFDAEFRRHVARQAAACVKSGAVDGIMLDWWHERPQDEADAKIGMLKEIREAIGPDALIIVNNNHEMSPRSAPFINGQFMECYKSKTPDDWSAMGEALRFGEQNFRKPHINCVETWYHQSRQDLNLMRATTTLALTMSDGYCLFSDPNSLPAPDHLHDWYDFWNKGLGRPLRAGLKRADGAWQRDFENGTAIYNPMGNNPITVSFDHKMKSRATGRIGNHHDVAPCDGDIFEAAK